MKNSRLHHVMALSLVIFFCLTSLIYAEESKDKKPIKETIKATRPLQGKSSTETTKANKPKSIVSVLEVKKKILEAMKGQDVLAVQKVMEAIDSAAEKSEIITEKILTKSKKYGSDFKEITGNIIDYTKQQFDLITNEDELYELEEALDEMHSIYSDKLDAARDEIITALDKFEDIYSEKIDAAMENADTLLEKVENKENSLNEHFSDIIDEMNELAYAMQDKFSDKVMELTEEMETELDSALEKYEAEIDKLIEKKEEELEKKEN